MSKLILPPVEISARAAAELAREAGEDRPRRHAIDKGAYYLAIGNVEIVHSFDGFLVTSATRAGTVHRVSHLHGCGCEAGERGRACWHQAVVHILERAGKYTMPALPKVETAPLGKPVAERIAAERYQAAKRAMDELFA